MKMNSVSKVSATSKSAEHNPLIELDIMKMIIDMLFGYNSELYMNSSIDAPPVYVYTLWGQYYLSKHTSYKHLCDWFLVFGNEINICRSLTSHRNEGVSIGAVKKCYIDEFYVLYNACVNMSMELLAVTDSHLLEIESNLLQCASPIPRDSNNPAVSTALAHPTKESGYLASMLRLHVVCSEYQLAIREMTSLLKCLLNMKQYCSWEYIKLDIRTDTSSEKGDVRSGDGCVEESESKSRYQIATALCFRFTSQLEDSSSCWKLNLTSEIEGRMNKEATRSKALTKANGAKILNAARANNTQREWERHHRQLNRPGALLFLNMKHTDMYMMSYSLYSGLLARVHHSTLLNYCNRYIKHSSSNTRVPLTGFITQYRGAGAACGSTDLVWELVHGLLKESSLEMTLNSHFAHTIKMSELVKCHQDVSSSGGGTSACTSMSTDVFSLVEEVVESFHNSYLGNKRARSTTGSANKSNPSAAKELRGILTVKLFGGEDLGGLAKPYLQSGYTTSGLELSYFKATETKEVVHTIDKCSISSGAANSASWNHVRKMFHFCLPEYRHISLRILQPIENLILKQRMAAMQSLHSVYNLKSFLDTAVKGVYCWGMGSVLFYPLREFMDAATELLVESMRKWKKEHASIDPLQAQVRLLNECSKLLVNAVQVINSHLQGISAKLTAECHCNIQMTLKTPSIDAFTLRNTKLHEDMHTFTHFVIYEVVIQRWCSQLSIELYAQYPLSLFIHGRSDDNSRSVVEQLNGVFQYLYSFHLIKYYLENTANFAHLYDVFPRKPVSNIDKLYHCRKVTRANEVSGVVEDDLAIVNHRKSIRPSYRSPEKIWDSQAAMDLSISKRHAHCIIPCKFNILQLFGNYISHILTYIHNEHVHESYGIWDYLVRFSRGETCVGLSECIAAFHRSMDHLSTLSDSDNHYNVALSDILEHTWVVFLHSETEGAIVDLMQRFHSLRTCLQYYHECVEFDDEVGRTDASRTIKHINDVLLTITPAPLS